MPLDFANYQPEDEILSILIKADQLLSGPEKWWRGKFMNATGVCAITATRFAKHPVRAEALGYLAAELPDGFCRIGKYNDASSTTFSDIKSLYACAIEKRRAEVLETVL